MKNRQPPSDIELRFATKHDIDLIYFFICELANYEKLLPEVVTTPEDLEKTLFGKRAYAEVVLAYQDEKPAGFALFFHNYSTFLGKPGIYLEDLYVQPEFRGKGVGSALFSFLANLTQERACGRLEWWVLDWNKEAIGFYEKIGAKAMDEWTVYRLTGDALADLAKGN